MCVHLQASGQILLMFNSLSYSTSGFGQKMAMLSITFLKGILIVLAAAGGYLSTFISRFNSVKKNEQWSGLTFVIYQVSLEWLTNMYF